MEAFVKTELSLEGVATITFFHPAQNSLPSSILADLARAIRAASDEPNARVIVLQSGGERTFCAGASFDELSTLQTPEAGKQFFSGFASVINAIRESSLLVLGRVQGKVVGGGVGLAAAADYCFATQHASIRLSELLIGIGPFVVGPAIERKIGLSAFTALTLNPNNFFSAQWAKEKGLYYEIFDDTSSMDAAVANFAQQLTRYNPEALQALKKAFWQNTDHWDALLAERAATSGRLVLSPSAKAAIVAATQKP